ncbi:MAG: hypothetical protein KF784_03755 [Fimbriimonadaceae bacterium]|nr:hypothetical protein [Fimbriimonadaceae bacterium]
MRKGIIWFLVGLFAIGVMGRYGYAKWRNRTYIPPSVVERVQHFERVVEADPSAFAWRQLGDAYVLAEQYEQAPIAYMNASEIFRAKGDRNAAVVMERLADTYETDTEVYYSRLPELNSVAKTYTAAKFEPLYGAYIGAFVDHEDKIKSAFPDEYGIFRRSVKEFSERVGTDHSVYFMYQGYGRQFPAKWTTHLKKNGAAAQIAFEPKHLKDVKDDEYLRGWARAAKASGVPIFLRFASEMNGDWTPYHGDPELYIEKWKLVTKVMREEAPNVAMVWCVFEMPQNRIDEYFPGDEWVDWVGLNVYSVMYFNNNPDKKGDHRNPADSVKYVYERYSPKHPIMICEYAASHQSSLDMTWRSELAQAKIGQFYASLPRLYPRVKAVCWLSMNAIKHAMEGRQRNNYSLLDDGRVAERYRQMVSSPYFIKQFGEQAKEEIVPIAEGQRVAGRLSLSAWVKTYINKPDVAWVVNGEEIARSSMPGPYQWTIDTADFPNGPASVELVVYNNAGEQISRTARKINIQN